MPKNQYLSTLLSSLLALTVATGCSVNTGLIEGTNNFNASGTKGPLPANAPEWTIFVYMAADNDLSDAGTKDLNEMEAGLTSDKVKFVVLADQEGVGDSRIIDIKHDPNGVNEKLVSTIVDDKGAVIPASKEVNTGSPETLAKFIQWGTRAYPSQRSMLVMWNHGEGVFAKPEHLKSFCVDFQSNDELNLVDLWRVMQNTATHTKFDILGFDTCLLGHTETAYQMTRLSSFLVSSEKTEPGDGWDYEAVAKSISAKPTMYPREFSAEIVKGYQAFYKKNGRATTLSSMDLKKVKEVLAPAVDTLGDVLTEAAKTKRADIKRLLDQAADESATGIGEDDAIDLGLMAKLLTDSKTMPDAVQKAAKEVQVELKRATVENLTTTTPAGVYSGLKIYYSPLNYNNYYNESSHQFFGTSGWGKFLKSFNAK